MMSTAKILVVESESIIALDIQETLEKAGYIVPAVAYSGRKAINLAAEVSPDLVLMDLELKGEPNSVNTANQISTRFNIPVVYLTTYPSAESLNTFCYIRKPFREEDLYTAVERAISPKILPKKRVGNLTSLTNSVVPLSA